ncbi:T9SS type A sorting domain-containing protein [Segetibacter sp. 3557_3]|uniref:T9SS type A sorting domain-containing protein n=1 Tax=Segetibacter sp. 3557_3 TaxID=2547429 RepID=UPI00105845B9|nr:T9SS type A sorting domain-containing protein [Segetibacter sp. 3557_3]TDH21384.1 T9SS type A sorting domain-containing protein [Segetibacter sp. 3557_3]
MKHLYLSLVFSALVSICFAQPKMQATIKPGNTVRTVDVYLKATQSFSQRDEAMTFAIAIPATVSAGPTLGSSGVTANSLGPIANIAGLQPNFLVNNLGTTQREVFVSKQTIDGVPSYIYTFIFAGTAPVLHNWVAGEEQQIFSIQFNGCTSNCLPQTQQLVNLPNGGDFGISYWYFQANTISDITDYANPFYANPKSEAPSNGGGTNGTTLSTVRLATPVSLARESKTSIAGTLKAPVESTTTISRVTIAASMESVSAMITDGKADVQVYPNPIENGVANLKMINQPKGVYSVKLLNAVGQVVVTKQVAHNGGSSNHSIALTNIAKGYYIMEVTGVNTKKAIKIVY